MQKYILTLVLFLIFMNWGFSQAGNMKSVASDFTIAFGSCNKQNLPQPLWGEILKNEPNLFIWGGDIIYGDSSDMTKIADDYKQQNSNRGYRKLKASVPLLGTWDDHDYGKNDAGAEWECKKESQQLFLDFMGVPETSLRRSQEGVYMSKIFELPKATVHVIVLDTRYFRSPLRKNEEKARRYLPHVNDEGTVLGKAQWKWLEEEFQNSYADFTIIMSSIQFLSEEHGFETWGNFPHEVKRLKELLVAKNVKNAIILSGDRHISEFSQAKVSGLSYPLIDFTSSGLTHSYSSYKGESNKYRIGNVVSVPSFGVLNFNFDTREVTMQIRGKKNIVLQEYVKKYKL